MRKMGKRLIFFLYGFIILILLNNKNIEVNAYNTNGYVLSNPSNVKYMVSSYVGPYATDTITY